MPDMDEFIDEIKDIWGSHWLTNMGEKHQLFQQQLENYLKVPYMELLTNGHMALELSLQAMGLSAGEVITTPFTFASTTHAIVRNGLDVVFCDINPEDYTIDVGQIEKLITQRTVAILPVHVYGNICDVEAIDHIARRHGLKVLYDAAHAFGEEYKQVGIGNFGDASCFSFHATKVFNSIEGGGVTFSNPEFGREIYKLKNFGIRDEETVDGVGANAKMNEFCAAMGICNLRHIDKAIAKRKALSESYYQHFEGIPGIRLSKVQKDVKGNYSYFPVLIDPTEFGYSRDDVQAALKKNNIGARKYFYPLTSDFDCFHGKYDSNLTPIAKKISSSVLTLPLYEDLEEKDVAHICKIILDMRK